MPFGEMIAVYSEHPSKPMNSQCSERRVLYIKVRSDLLASQEGICFMEIVLVKLRSMCCILTTVV